MAQQISIEEAWGKPFHPDENAGGFAPTHKQPAQLPVIPRADMTKVRPADGDADAEDDKSVTQNPNNLPAQAPPGSESTTPRTHVFAREDADASSMASINESQLLSDEMRALQQKISASFASTAPPDDATSGVMVSLGDIFAKLNEVLLAVMGEKDGTSKERRSPMTDILIMVAVGLFIVYILDIILRLGQSMAKATIKYAT